MATQTNTLSAWTENRDTLTDNLQSILAFLQKEPFSADPASAYVKAQKRQDQTLDDLRRLAVVGIKQIDDAIAASDVVQQINTLSKQARQEADKLKNAAKTIDGISKAVDLAAGVVAKFNALPFV